MVGKIAERSRGDAHALRARESNSGGVVSVMFGAEDRLIWALASGLQRRRPCVTNVARFKPQIQCSPDGV
jgi:hypothetical protein